MICWKCGNQIDEGSLFCPYCGSQQAQQSGPAAGQQMQGEFNQRQMGMNSPQQQMGTNPAPQQMGMNPAPQQNGGNGAPKKNKEPQSHVGMMVGAICASLAALMLIGLVILMVVRGHSSDDQKERRTEKTTEQASATSTEATTEEAASTEASTEATTETAKVDDETLESARAAYLKILNNHSSAIEAYNWQRGYNSTYNEPVTIEDINSDGIPELIFFEAENEYLAGYYIYGYKDGEAVLLSDIQDIDAEVAGGTVYYVGALKDSNDLFVYHGVTDEGSEEFFYEMNLTEDGLYKKGAEYQRNAFPNDDYTSMNVTYYKDGAEISESDFNDFVNSKQDNIRTFISYSEGEDIANLVDIKGSVCIPMDRAKEELGGDSADTETAASDGALPLGDGMEFCFASGAGGWGTYMTVKSDGSFVGNYHDSDMGDIGEGYPNGTVYFCNFSGQFKNITKIDDYTYKMELDSYDMENEAGTEEIKDEMKYVYSAAYGIDGGKTFYLYLPGKPVSELTEGFISWSYGVVGDISSSQTLQYYGIHNVEEDEGFFVYTY